MIGQNKLITKFNGYTLDILPHSIILLGESGCGKHTLVNELIKKYKVDLYDISENISSDTIDEIYINSNTVKFYLINSSNLTYSNQNKILKFIEEPLENIYVFILTDSLDILLSTVKNRCVVFEFEKYTLDELKQFSDDDLILKVCHTPGQIKNILNSNYDLSELDTLCSKVVDKLNVASLSNTLSILNKLDLNDTNKFNVSLFIYLLKNKYYNNFINSSLELSYKLYNIVDRYSYLLSDTRLIKKYLLENMLIDLWSTVRGL